LVINLLFNPDDGMGLLLMQLYLSTQTLANECELKKRYRYFFGFKNDEF
jgi:hypothetical protein